ncbi:hypothetical protein [Imbroritus primus]|uniref:hypothetical protein n=1 Tax=Imbroritus primus TaxID=3058603 RepID=UPI003D160601
MTIQNFSLGPAGGIAAGAGGTATFDLNGAGAAPAGDVARFDQAMTADSNKSELQPLEQTGGSLPSMGARILEGFTGMSNNYAAVMKRVSGTAGREMETVQLLRNLADMMQLSNDTGLLSKVVGKGTQTVSDLTK